MSPAAWIALGLAAGVFITTIALCVAAARGDSDLLAPHPDEQDQLADVLHFDCERRRRRGDLRNGIGGAA
jgi:hypothetical protein